MGGSGRTSVCVWMMFLFSKILWRIHKLPFLWGTVASVKHAASSPTQVRHGVPDRNKEIISFFILFFLFHRFFTYFIATKKKKRGGSLEIKENTVWKVTNPQRSTMNHRGKLMLLQKADGIAALDREKTKITQRHFCKKLTFRGKSKANGVKLVFHTSPLQHVNNCFCCMQHNEAQVCLTHQLSLYIFIDIGCV